ncbi:hypothetical protein CDAR_250091 [Caerostris darwini]|uniref:Uncharacterized protein n=1 Tax=Caerostris darwini TaxID=1538125 RepID=A0AAV4R6Q7_9ARAC|nr:hypothetical protein CDAR_250091 [Caerostris darwini]
MQFTYEEGFPNIPRKLIPTFIAKSNGSQTLLKKRKNSYTKNFPLQNRQDPSRQARTIAALNAYGNNFGSYGIPGGVIFLPDIYFHPCHR